MDLFKSVLSDYDHQPDSPDSPQSSIDDPTTPSSWSFNTLIKTLTTKSESVIGSYRREFEEFGSELKKETSLIRQVASRAVKGIPDSLEIGTSVAQESLESVGQAIDDIGATVWKSTARIISHGKESLTPKNSNSDSRNQEELAVKPYNRFEMQLLAIQSDKATYLREPDNLGHFENWKLGFKLEEEEKSEIADLLNENKAVEEIYKEIVPVEIDAETFWRRYFYKVHKLELVEEARVKLMNRAVSGEEDEDLTWDLDDEGDETCVESSLNHVQDMKSSVTDENEAEKDGKSSESSSETVVLLESREVSSSKDSDISVISTQPSFPEVEDLGWDKMEEDIRSNEDKSLETGQGAKERHRRVSMAEEEEDLTWDIEDEDDESIKQ